MGLCSTLDFLALYPPGHMVTLSNSRAECRGPCPRFKLCSVDAYLDGAMPLRRLRASFRVPAVLMPDPTV